MGIIGTWKTQLRTTFTDGDPAIPQWQFEFEKGDDAGYFPVGSAVWTVHSSMTPTVAGIRALLLQALHPGAMAGVHGHSSFREEPLGRLANTIRWIFTVTYGSRVAAQEGSAFVQRLHTRVHGTYVDSRGGKKSYSAADPDLIRWVHLAFTDAFVAAHASYGGPIPGGVDQYVAEWAQAGELMGLEDPPRSEAELRSQLAAFDGELTTSDQVREALTYIRRPPLPWSQRLGYQVLFAGAVATLEPRHREMLGLRVPSLGPVPLPLQSAVRLVLGMIRLGLGPEGPAEAAAKRRIRRVTGAAADGAAGVSPA
ncbi:oxygenase MpaB family protein [Arthrobacter sedimenti]|uniref:oxygenase MpaB family protein n=1 Tax=Arthrobacter sedimenti TaxID=2694931 RepID=UPI000B362BF0|nr:oxygenase MpaB family protein [Arthrobacter sedimenti]